MNSSMRNTRPEILPNRSIGESEAARAKAHQLADHLMEEEVLEGFRKLAAQKKAREAPHQAA